MAPPCEFYRGTHIVWITARPPEGCVPTSVLASVPTGAISQDDGDFPALFSPCLSFFFGGVPCLLPFYLFSLFSLVLEAPTPTQLLPFSLGALGSHRGKSWLGRS